MELVLMKERINTNVQECKSLKLKDTGMLIPVSARGLLWFKKIFSRHSESKNDAIFDERKKLKLGESLEMMLDLFLLQLMLIISKNNHVELCYAYLYILYCSWGSIEF